MKAESEVAIMFSGGVDTALLAVVLAKRFKKVHLLTFCNGVCVRLNASKKMIPLLRERFGEERIIHHLIPVSERFRELRKYVKCNLNYSKSPLVFDLCCRFSMELATVEYCKKNGICYVSEGSNPFNQGQIFIQKEEYLVHVKKFFSANGLDLLWPHLRFGTRKNMERFLRREGFPIAREFFRFVGVSTHFFNQPFCLWAFVSFFFTSALRKIPIIKCFDLPMSDAVFIREELEKKFTV